MPKMAPRLSMEGSASNEPARGGLERSSAFRGESESRGYRGCCDRGTGRAPKCGARDVLGAQRIGLPAPIQDDPPRLISHEPCARRAAILAAGSAGILA